MVKQKYGEIYIVLIKNVKLILYYILISKLLGYFHSIPNLFFKLIILDFTISFQ